MTDLETPQPLAFVRNWSARTFSAELQLARTKLVRAKTEPARITAALWLRTLEDEARRRACCQCCGAHRPPLNADRECAECAEQNAVCAHGQRVGYCNECVEGAP